MQRRRRKSSLKPGDRFKAVNRNLDEENASDEPETDVQAKSVDQINALLASPHVETLRADGLSMGELTLRRFLEQLCDQLALNKTLKMLSLASNGLKHTHAEALGKAIRLHPTLKRLVLRDNEINTHGANMLGRGAEGNTIVRHIDLDENKLGPEFPTELLKLPCLAKLDLYGNSLEQLPERLALAQQIEDLDVRRNRIEIRTLPYALNPRWLTEGQVLRSAAQVSAEIQKKRQREADARRRRARRDAMAKQAQEKGRKRVEHVDDSIAQRGDLSIFGPGDSFDAHVGQERERRASVADHRADARHGGGRRGSVEAGQDRGRGGRRVSNASQASAASQELVGWGSDEGGGSGGAGLGGESSWSLDSEEDFPLGGQPVAALEI